jgi:MoaA/NifB/PqqE/SkfB family radical SAM enzyme
VEIVHHARRLRYKPISLFTNSLLLPEREEVLEDLDFVQISLDTTNEAKQDELAGEAGTGQRVKRHIQHYARFQKRWRFRININCVLSASTLEDLPDLVRFAEKNSVSLTVCPKLDDEGQPVDELRAGEGREQYRFALNDLLLKKAQGTRLMDLASFLEHIKTFEPYTCYPELSARIYPDGSFVSPCPTLSTSEMNVLRARSWKRLREATNGNGMVCNRPCFLPCYLETSLMMRHPIELFRELSR